MALGAIEAIAESGKTGTIKVVGFDASLEARNVVEKGLMLATVAQFPFDMGKRVIENAVLILQGQRIDKDIEIPIQLVTKGELGYR